MFHETESEHHRKCSNNSDEIFKCMIDRMTTNELTGRNRARINESKQQSFCKYHVTSSASQKRTSDSIPVGSSFLRKRLKDPTRPDTLSKADSVKDFLRTFIKEQIISYHINGSCTT
jgi:hypothetical protein